MSFRKLNNEILNLKESDYEETWFFVCDDAWMPCGIPV